MENKQRILFIGLSCVGDAVMTTPVLQALHQAYPEACIDIVADSRSSDIFQHCPYRGKFYYKDKARFLRGAPGLLKELWKTRYDIIVDLRTDGLTLLMRGREKFTKRKAASYGPHAIEGFMGVIKKIHKDSAIPSTTTWLNEELLAAADAALNKTGAGRVLAMAPGCGGKNPRKFWPTENYAALANRLADKFNRVVLLGSAEDSALTGQIADQLNLPALDVAGKTGLLEAAALLQKSGVFVGSDSGLGHVAGSVGTPTLTFFSVDQPSRCLPWGPAAHYLEGKDGDARNIPVDSAEQSIRAVLNS